jgi:hypothetical protein
MNGSLRRAAVLLPLVLLVASIGGAIQGRAATSTKYYGVTLSPSTIGRGATTTVVVTLTNSSGSTQSLGGANVSVPTGSGFGATPAAGTATSVGGKAWTVSNSNPIQLRAATNSDALPPGDSVSVNVTVTASCTATSAVFQTQAKQSNSFNGPPGNDFAPLAGTPPTLSVTGSCSFAFDPISSPQVAGTPFNVTVRAVDGLGNPAAYNGTATLSGTFSSAHGTPAGLGTISFSGGVATSSVTSFTAESGQTLTATNGSMTGTSSPGFTVDPAAPYKLEFGQQPTVTDVAPAVISPAVTVKVLDQYGNLNTVPAQQQSVSLAMNPNVYGSTLGGTTTQLSSGGVATFGDLTVSASGENLTIGATSGTLQPATSLPFSVWDKTCPANSQLLCQGNDKKATTFVNVSLPNFGTGYTQLAFSDIAQPFTCDGSGMTSHGALATINPPPGYEWPNYISTTLRFSKTVAPGTGVANFVLCLKKPDQTQYANVLDCPKNLRESALPCVSKRNRNGVGELVMVLLHTSTDPVAGLGP